MRKEKQLLIIFFATFFYYAFAQGELKQAKVIAPKPLQWGVNIHDGGSDPGNVANKIAKRNLKYVRMDFVGHKPDELSRFIIAAKLMNENEIKCNAILFSEFAHNRARMNDYSANLNEVEQSVYNDIKHQVLSTKDLKMDFELQNEVSLYPDMKVKGSTGRDAIDFNTPAGRLQAAALRGMSRAVDDVRQLYKLPIRIILGTVGRDYGFLKFMQQQGVIFDVVGYHIYPWENAASLNEDPWFGEGGLFTQLAKFNMPIQINEFNCGEIYSGGPKHPGKDYENKAGQPVTDAGFRSLYKHLNEIINQNVANVEGVYFYELIDELNKEVPENRFGLYYDEELKLPKISLLLATAFAGGKLSKAEKDTLKTRGFTCFKPIER